MKKATADNIHHDLEFTQCAISLRHCYYMDPVNGWIDLTADLFDSFRLFI